MKRCTKCGEEKDEDEFGNRRDGRDGLTSECKVCSRLRARAWEASNRDRNNARARKWSAENKEKVRVVNQRWYKAHPDKVAEAEAARKQRRHSDPIVAAKGMLRRSRLRARDAMVPHTITLEDLLPIPEICPVLGVTMPLSGEAYTDKMASLDRIVPALGYIPGNVAIMSNRANKLKGDGTIAEHEAIVAFMKRHAAQQGHST